MADEPFLAFHGVASARKMSLAMRGLPVNNFMVDALWEQAEAAGVERSAPAWEAWLAEQCPSPRDNSKRPLRAFAELALDARLGDADCSVRKTLGAVRFFVSFCDEVGLFAAASVKEATTNTAKIDAAFKALQAQSADVAALDSLDALLKTEAASGVHGVRAARPRARRRKPSLRRPPNPSLHHAWPRALSPPPRARPLPDRGRPRCPGRRRAPRPVGRDRCVVGAPLSFVLGRGLPEALPAEPARRAGRELQVHARDRVRRHVETV